MAIMADFARLPTRQKVMVFVLIGGLVALIYWKFFYQSLKEQLEAAEADNQQKTTLNNQLPRDIAEYEALRARMSLIQRQIEENQKALPTEAELPAFFETLNRKVIDSGVEVLRSTQAREEPVERFIKVPINYEIQGTFVQIKKFFASLLPKKKRQDVPAGEQPVEERERIVSIENLSLSNPFVRNREIVLTARFTASTYRQIDAAPAAPPKAKAAPAPEPKTSTPKGAKAATEKSMQKSEERMKGGL